MVNITLNHQASTVIAKCDSTGEFLLGQYDPNYPGKNKHWIGRVKLLGGNYFFGKDSDNSPLDTYIREIGEEFSGEKAAAEEMAATQQHNFASQLEITMVRDAMLIAEPLQDYLGSAPSIEGPPVYVIQTVYKASLDKDVIQCVRDNLAGKRSLTNEGFLTIKTLDELKRGDPLTQGLTGLIIGQTENTVLPHCLRDCVTFAPIGKPRDSYEAYLDSFNYRAHSKK